jgi:hypothetical protein
VSEVKETLLCDPFGTGLKVCQYIETLSVMINSRCNHGASVEATKRACEHIHDFLKTLSLADRKDRLNVGIRVLSKFTNPPDYDEELHLVNVMEALR